MNAKVRKSSFYVYYDHEVIISRLSDVEAGQLFKSLFHYGRDGIEPNFSNIPALDMAFVILSMTMKPRKKII